MELSTVITRIYEEGYIRVPYKPQEFCIGMLFAKYDIDVTIQDYMVFAI